MAAMWINERYRFVRTIFKSLISSVLLCTDETQNDDDNKVIIKLYNELQSGDSDLQRKVFNREVESLEMVNHKNIVRILEKGFDNLSNSYYIALEYIDGSTLKDSRDQIGNYDFEDKITFVMQIIDGMEYLHKHNIVHRDIKPSNIMIDKNGVVKIIDFGISRLEDTFYSDYTLSMHYTEKYSSPEQILKKEVSYKSDIFSLGLVLTEIFTGKEVKQYGKADMEALDPELQMILEKMTEDNPELRYSTMSEVKNAFIHLQSLCSRKMQIRLRITRFVATRLYSMGYISENEISSAYPLLCKEYAGKCYMRRNLNGENKFDGTFSLYGHQFSSRLKPDQNDNRHLVVIGIGFPEAQIAAGLKEAAYEVPYAVKPMAGAYWAFSSQDVDANVLVEEVLSFEDTAIAIKKQEIQEKSIANRWKKILDLQRKKLESEKLTIRYSNLIIKSDENCLSVVIKDNDAEKAGQYSVNTEILQMTAKLDMNKHIDVGYMRSYSKGIMIIDFYGQVDYDNIAESGEISISQRMAEISLQRQSKALKAFQFRENVNPAIADIITMPGSAMSRSNLMLRKVDCHSELIDDSKLRSLEKALSANDLFLLQGPPGTGKTTFIAELVWQIINGNSQYKGNQDAKILIASQSHVAVDHSLSKIRESMPNLKMIRIGMPEKISEASRDFTLDAYCREWTKEVIQKCRKALDEYKKQVSLNPELQEKHKIIAEIDEIRQEFEKLQEELNELNSELDKVEIIGSKWKYLNDKIDGIRQMISTKTKGVDEETLTFIIDAFTESIDEVNGRIGNILEESVASASQRLELRARKQLLEKHLSDDEKEIADRWSILGVDSEEEYDEVRAYVSTRIKEKEKLYTQYTKVEALCNEWQIRVTQGDGLLQESVADTALVGATCLGIASLSGTINFVFDWVIIDEAGKATPSEIMVPMSLGKKVVLVGDHKQLPPVVDQALLELDEAKEMQLKREDLETSLFEYLETGLKNECKEVLDEQYRMNPVIGDLISNVFYDGMLKSRTKKEKTTIPIKRYGQKPLIWLDTGRIPIRTEEKIDNNSYRNVVEARIIFEELDKINEELKALEIEVETAIIAGYSAQRDAIQKLYDSKYSAILSNMKVEINTVDAFQGRETDIVFYSVVRSNDEGNLGFLSDVRRLNVAFSRARQLLVVVGDRRCTQLRNHFYGKPNPFIGVVSYIRSHPEDCAVKEV